MQWQHHPQCVCCMCHLSGTASHQTPLGSHISPSPHSECTSHRSDKYWLHRAGSLRRSVEFVCQWAVHIVYIYILTNTCTYVHDTSPSWYMYSCRINCVLCSLPCSEHVSPKYPGAQLHVLLATQTPVPFAHGGLQTTARVRVTALHDVHYIMHCGNLRSYLTVTRYLLVVLWCI